MKIMNEYKNDAAVQWQSLACMANLLAQNSDKYKLVAEEHGVIESSIAALVAFKESPMVQAEGCRCLMNACNTVLKNEDRAVARGAIEKAVIAMQTFPTIPEVNEMASRLILCLVWSRMVRPAFALPALATPRSQTAEQSASHENPESSLFSSTASLLMSNKRIRARQPRTACLVWLSVKSSPTKRLPVDVPALPPPEHYSTSPLSIFNPARLRAPPPLRAGQPHDGGARWGGPAAAACDGVVPGEERGGVGSGGAQQDRVVDVGSRLEQRRCRWPVAL